MQVIGTADLFEAWDSVIQSFPQIKNPAAVIYMEFFDG
jgi:hypothetical protein